MQEHLIRASASGAREAVRQRDRGVCAACGTDTVALRREYVAACAASGDAVLTAMTGGWVERTGLTRRELRARREWWDVDHIRPVHRGGGAAGLDNLQTLCVRCHKAKTAAEAAARAGREGV